jgi:ribosome biogenesis GTPase / thiamine phosphate phosphatase
MFELSALGFGPFFEAQLKDRLSECLRPARIASEHRDRYEVWSEEGIGIARLAGRLRREQDDFMRPCAGDWVGLKSVPEPDQIQIIERVFQRRTVFTRGSAGQEAHGQMIAANIDLVFVVCGLDADYSVRRIERYLARIWASGAQPAVILNKADVCNVTEQRAAEVEARSPGVPVFVASAVRSAGLEVVRERILPGLTAAFVGSSGAGKSTLINALVGEERMATREVRTDDCRGRHTTTRRQLVFLPGGGLLLDTPGMRELQLVDDDGIAATFADIEALADKCRYRDCRHDNEPGCAVRAAVAAGQLARERWEHYRKLEREARAYELRHDLRLKRQAERVWRSLKREGEIIRRHKEGR